MSMQPSLDSKPTQGRNRMKNVVPNLEYGFPVFKFLQHQICLSVEGSISMYLEFVNGRPISLPCIWVWFQLNSQHFSTHLSFKPRTNYHLSTIYKLIKFPVFSQEIRQLPIPKPTLQISQDSCMSIPFTARIHARKQMNKSQISLRKYRIRKTNS